jgi:SAM-dependent methyltransferase
MDRHAHWETVYRNKADAELSWFQARPELSLKIIEEIKPRPRSAIDIGAGQSSLAGDLVAMGIPVVAALDVSEAALERARVRLGERAEQVRWIAADVAADPTPELAKFDLWHDRAVFHFLTEAEDRRRYAALTAKTVTPGGHVVVATFGPEGPEKCSGLPVRRYDAAGIAAELGPAFELVGSAAETHQTPWGKGQAFAYAVLRRR